MSPFFRLTTFLCGLLAVLLPVAAQEPRGATMSPSMFFYEDRPTVRLVITGVDLARGTLSQDAMFEYPVGQVFDRQRLQIEVFTPTPVNVTWAEGYMADYAIPKPTKTNAGRTLWGLRYHAEDRAWHFIATTTMPAEGDSHGRP